MEYAVFKTGGKQYKVSKGDILDVEKLALKSGQEHSIKEVFLYVKDGVCKIGSPLVLGASVKVKILDNIKQEKVRVAKFKSKARYRRVMGHRQLVTKLMVEDIIFN
ncbi:MAG: 50S ribosomal protein L21 [Patescibacteria group bacterium]|nr:50S ribosomal protein L21 [Patescibacteria group bacterium]